jgi:acetyltransferase-like isoleucine patch superfamily enzyme
MAERPLRGPFQPHLPPLPEPDRVREETIARCRAEVEGAWKSAVRAVLLPWLRRRLGLAELGEGFHWGRGIALGRGSRIGRFAYLGAGFAAHGPVVVGDLCMIAAGCRIVGADHRFDIAGTPTRLGWRTAPRRTTVFEADVWVGERVTILEGVTIGAGAVVGSGALVTRDVPQYAVVAGTPARLVRNRFREGEQDTHDRQVRARPTRTAA